MAVLSPTIGVGWMTMQNITSPDQIEVGKWYWCLSRKKGALPICAKCIRVSGKVYLNSTSGVFAVLHTLFASFRIKGPVEPPSFEDVERDPDIPAAVLRDCWNCETPITLIGRSGNDVSPPICPHCGAIDPCGHGPVKRT